MKILVTGAKGQLGSEVYGLLHTRGYQVVGVDIQELDITIHQAVIDLVRQESPEVIINCAAFTDVDGCEFKKDLAYRVNAIGPQNLAAACLDQGATLVHISTDFVFDGKGTEPYNEFAPVNPLSIYGKSKLAGEQLVKEICPRHFIIRTAWLYGHGGKNFAKTVLQLAQERAELRIVNDQRGTPTYTKDLAVAIERLLSTRSFGTYHITNNGECTWYEFALKLLELCGINKTVKPITSQELGRPVTRPTYSVLRNYMLELTSGDPMRSWTEALNEYALSLREHFFANNG